MARTKKQATTAKAKSAQGLSAVKEGGNNPVGTATANHDSGKVDISESGSGRAQRPGKREASRRRTNREEFEEAGEPSGMEQVEMETQADDEGDSGDHHMTPALGVESENYYTALDREATEAWKDDSSAGPSEAPIVKSPHKAGASGAGSRKQHTAGGHEKDIRTTKRKSNKVIAEQEGGTVRFTTPENTRGMRGDSGQTSARGGRPKKRKEATYLVRVRPVVEALLGNLELILVEVATSRQGEQACHVRQ
jgi:hypothetical protein